MKHPISTIPAFGILYSEMRKFLKNVPELKRLRNSGDAAAERELLRRETGAWAERTSRRLKINYEINGEENIPESGPIMVYCNHQSLSDIAAILYLFRNHFQMGFIAKNEWRKIKPLADSIEYTRSVFLIRDNAREAVRALNEASWLLDQGFSLTIFPEGTRAKSSVVGTFKPGSFKFAQKAGVPILPVSINGSYHIWEETGDFQPNTSITVTVHPLVHTEQMSRQEQLEAFKQIEQLIRSDIS